MALYEGKWLLCMHKERTTWEHPSGWIEEGETPLEAEKENCTKKQAQLRSTWNLFGTFHTSRIRFGKLYNYSEKV